MERCTDQRRWFAQTTNRRPKTKLGPFETREAAVSAVFNADPRAQDVMSGRGLDGPYGDITWTRRRDWKGNGNEQA